MSRPRVILIKPPEASRFDFGAFSLGVLAAYVRDIAEITIIDATDGETPAVIEHIWSLDPDVVGITAMGLDSVQPVRSFLESLLCDGAGRETPVLVGGHGATGAPACFLEAGATAVVSGEGELTFRSVLEHGIEPRAPGITCLLDGELIAGPVQRLIRPLDRLPPPARDLMPPPRDGVHLMETSRGCPHRCAFCETTRFYGSTWRGFSPERVAGDVAGLVEDYGAWTILFADDNFAASPVRVLEICERLRRGPLPATFLASVRADDVLSDPGLVPAMAAARMLRVTVGVETLEPDAAAAIGKPIDRAVYREAFAKLRAHGIFSVASFITGLPGQHLGVRATVELAVEAGPDVAIFVPFIPMPGTPLARSRKGSEASAADQDNAREMTAAFFRHPEVRRRLAEAQAAGGIRGLMAQAVCDKHLRGSEMVDS